MPTKTFEVKKLMKLLSWFNIPVDKFGKGEAKSVQNLLDEINNGDCRLIISRDGIYREVFVIRAYINYKGLILKEDKQVFDDGRIRERNYFHISEKIRVDEKFEEALKRAVKKELGIESKLNWENRSVGEKEDMDSLSYPMLTTRYLFFDRLIFFTDEQYKEEGYTEYKKSTGITTHFKWFSVDSSISKELKCKLFNLIEKRTF